MEQCLPKLAYQMVDVLRHQANREEEDNEPQLDAASLTRVLLLSKNSHPLGLVMKTSQDDNQKFISVDSLTPSDIANQISKIGVSKARAPFRSLVVLGLLGGLYIGFGGALATLVLTDNGLGFGLSRFVAGLAFSLGLIMLVVGGGELFTGNNLMMVACANRSISWFAAGRNWILTYPANAAGALALAYAIHLSGILQGGNMKTTAVNIAEAKVHLSASSAFVRGILCNMLVCLAVWLSISARSVEGKAVVIMFPIGAFVALGFEHCIANFYIIPVGMFSGAEIELHEFIFNVAIVTAGNTVGGAVIAAAYYNVFLRTSREVDRTAVNKQKMEIPGSLSASFTGGFAFGVTSVAALGIISAGWVIFFSAGRF